LNWPLSVELEIRCLVFIVGILSLVWELQSISSWRNFFFLCLDAILSCHWDIYVKVIRCNRTLFFTLNLAAEQESKLRIH
jgi:hypothetical protein